MERPFVRFCRSGEKVQVKLCAHVHVHVCVCVGVVAMVALCSWLFAMPIDMGGEVRWKFNGRPSLLLLLMSYLVVCCH